MIQPDEQLVKPDPAVDALVAAVLAGDRESYRHLISLGEASVRLVLAAILPAPDSVEDIAQEVFVRAYTKLGDYEPGSDFVLWLKAIARNLALNERRRWFRQVRFKDRFQAEIERMIEPVLASVGDRYDGNVLEALRECLQRLEQPSRELTEDFYFHDVSSEEIARRFERKGSWVRLILFRARASIAACLQAKGVE